MAKKKATKKLTAEQRAKIYKELAEGQPVIVANPVSLKLQIMKAVAEANRDIMRKMDSEGSLLTIEGDGVTISGCHFEMESK